MNTRNPFWLSCFTGTVLLDLCLPGSLSFEGSSMALFVPETSFFYGTEDLRLAFSFPLGGSRKVGQAQVNYFLSAGE
ncbi:Hypothetical protein Minf_0530 [Methylacidiphilum infernorum V4]|uniref:Uncharacterized protein n=1 Tax=Methylacidiphilum infernorum (isolate V4) TaxID=481448 RepID=B3DZH1_METI4|nr:Hypothetical protein Minf_0530 [Methylacidiphilum infernorum V4]